MPFNDLGLLPELLSTLKPKAYPAPTPVQSEFIPSALTGRDVWVTAPTGSGKTLLACKCLKGVNYYHSNFAKAYAKSIVLYIKLIKCLAISFYLEVLNK